MIMGPILHKFVKYIPHINSIRSPCCISTIVKEQNCRINEPNSMRDALEVDKEYEAFANRYFGQASYHRCFIIHPYVKWGTKKLRDTVPQHQMEEAVSLINTLSPWTVSGVTTVSLTHFYRKTLFGSGTLERLKNEIRNDLTITAVFINLGTLKNMQLKELQSQFGLPILDRYRIVMQILKLHAISKHARLQVALAEIPYLKSRLKQDDIKLIVSENYETRKLMLNNREQKIKTAIKELKSQRELLRNRRKQLDYPVVAIVGYTNVGKTSLIKALTGEERLQPKNHLFATLDVTMHLGQLPSKLQILYVDTVGFMYDIPTTLIECFIVTLEDAMHADVIVHVEDLSSKDLIHQRNHVLSTLKQLASSTGSEDVLNRIITVGNKSDIASDVAINKHIIPVSSVTHSGIDLFRLTLEKAVLDATGRKIITIKVPAGGKEMRWLYKNATVLSTAANEVDGQLQDMRVIVSRTTLEQFKHNFIKGN